MAKILFLEDDEILAESLIDLLEAESFELLHVKNGEEALDASFDTSYDIYLFDVNVDKLSGFEVLKSLRESGDTTPAIFLTAMGDVASLSEGFDVGADDYIKKPFDFDELVVRINAILKKRYNSYKTKIKLQDFTFDTQKNELYKNDQFIALAPIELKITQIFFQNLDKTIAKEDLLNELSYEKEMSAGSLRVHINKLRKIELPITTIKGVGYRLSSS